MLKRKVLITGAGGQLGSEFCKILKDGSCELGKIDSALQNSDIYGLTSKDLNISDLNYVCETIEKIRPDYIINCAAYTNVDACETNETDAFRVNAIGARNLAIATNKINSKLVHISTDYVFDGMSSKPYIESDNINPQNIYGKSKALGEFYIQNFCKRWFIVRTSWLYGVSGNNFVKTIINNARSKGKLKVVDDQFGSPTNVCDLTYSVCKLVETNEFGIFHGSGNGSCSWFEFAQEIVSCFNIDAIIEPCTTQEFVRPAVRPKFSLMENLMFKLTIGDFFREWKEALKAYSKNVDQN